MIDFDPYVARAKASRGPSPVGRVHDVVGMLVEVAGLTEPTGGRLEIDLADRKLAVEVLGFKNGRLLCAPLGSTQGVEPGAPVRSRPHGSSVPAGEALLGRVLDAFGMPLDDGPVPVCPHRVPLYRKPPPSFNRKPIHVPLETGVRVLDGILPLGRGQRVGLFAGTGVGKSTLLAMLCRRAQADVVVVSLVGERGREVGDFGRGALGPGLARSIVVAATSDQAPLVRVQGALAATAIAEHFRDKGANVLLVMDSVTRFAMALREASLAAGEPPVTKGYTPSVFALMPKLLERAGTSERGSITGFYTVLVEGDDFNEPICDAARSILDGHIMLTRELAARNHYPAIDVLNSVSRVMPAVTSADHRAAAARARRLLATYEKARDLVNIGAYVAGSDPEIDAALEALPTLMGFLQQGVEFAPFEETTQRLSALANGGSHGA